MRSEVLVNAIAKSGGFFFSDLIDEDSKARFLKYLKRNDFADVITRSFRSEFGYIFKLRDDIIFKYYPYDARKRVFYQTHSDSKIERSSRFHVSDLKLFQSFVKFSVWRKYYYSVIPKRFEKSSFKEYDVLDHRLIGTSLAYAYDYSNRKVIVIVMDFNKSIKKIISIIEFYNSERYKIIIATLKDADSFETDLYKLINTNRNENRFVLETDIEVANFPKINNFFGL